MARQVTGVAAIPPISPVEAPEEVLDIAESMRLKEPSRAEQELEREGISPADIARERKTRGGARMKQLLAAAIVILLLLALVFGFFQWL